MVAGELAVLAVGEPAQADYERLRALALAAEPCDELLVARRFERHGRPAESQAV